MERYVAILFVLFSLLVPFGMPGTLTGWCGSLLLGLQAGRVFFRDFSSFYQKVFLFSVVAGQFLGLEILAKIITTGLTHEIQSDYFQSASINYANSLLIGCATITSTIWMMRFAGLAGASTDKKSNFYIYYSSVFISCFSIAFAILMDYRSGLIAVAGIFTFLICRFSKVFLYSTLVMCLVFLVRFSDEVIAYLVPGRDDLSMLFTELGEDDNRIERSIKFISSVLLDKSNFERWSTQFSTSALGDFIAAAFPASIILLLYIFFYLRNAGAVIFRLNRSTDRLSLSLLLMSGLAVALLQPDFFNLFVLGFQSSLINATYTITYPGCTRVKDLHKTVPARRL